MKFLSEEIVSNTEVIKSYKECSEKAKELSKLVIFKNNKPDMVLMSISEYEKICSLLEELEHRKIYDVVQERESVKDKDEYSLDQVKNMFNIDK